MDQIARLFFLLTLVLCGGYAGMVLMCQVGVLPGLGDLEPRSFAVSWRAMDRYMGRLMPPYKGALLLSNLVTVLLCFRHRPHLAGLCALSLLLSIAGLVLTIRKQLPVNDELKSDALPDARIVELRERTTGGFRTRFVLAALAFVLLSFGAVFLPLKESF